MPNGWIRGNRGFYRGRFPVPAGYEYVGPCRCGCGPHAFYRTPTGHITGTPLAHVPSMKPEEEAGYLEEEAKALQEELSRVEERIRELRKKS